MHRHAELGSTIKYWVRPDIENRIKEGSVKARFESHVVEITPTAVVIEGPGGREELPAEGVFLLTGYRPDVELMQRAGVACDPETLAPAMNAETFETNVPNLFVAGGAVAGRHTGNIFIENGRFHGEQDHRGAGAAVGRLGRVGHVVGRSSDRPGARRHGHSARRCCRSGALSQGSRT